MNPLLKNAILILVGIFSAGLGLKSFLLPNRFIDGGATGIALLITEISTVPFGVLLIVVNIPFLIAGYYRMGRNFAVIGLLSILGLALVTSFVPYPIITTDKLLASTFGGFFLGMGIGLAVRGVSVLDGTEIVALLLSKRVGISVGDIILAFNIVIFGVATLLLGVETALYSILTYLAASKTVDFVMHGIEENNGVIIISQHSDHIKQCVIDCLQRGVTVFKGEGGFTGEPQNILFVVASRFEVPRLRRVIQDADPSAFIVIYNISDASGGTVKRPAYKH